MTEHEERAQSRDGARARRSAKPASMPPAAVAKQVSAELGELLGRPAEGVISLARTDDGWCVGVEVVETRRIPDTADVIAEYEVDADRRGHLISYHRVRRYARGRVGDDR